MSMSHATRTTKWDLLPPHQKGSILFSFKLPFFQIPLYYFRTLSLVFKFENKYYFLLHYFVAFIFINYKMIPTLHSFKDGESTMSR